MQVEYRLELMAEPKLLEMARTATTVLEGAIGESAKRALVTWGLRRDELRRTTVLLTIADWSEEVTAVFTPEELQQLDDVRWRSYRIWGDLLQQASRRQIEKLEASFALDE